MIKGGTWARGANRFVLAVRFLRACREGLGGAISAVLTKQDKVITKDCHATRCKEVLYLREVQADLGLPILDLPSLGAH